MKKGLQLVRTDVSKELHVAVKQGKNEVAIKSVLSNHKRALKVEEYSEKKS